MLILIVEDDKDLRGHLRQGLKAEGFSIDLAADGMEGRRLASENLYDVVLLDIGMPGIDGKELLRTLRKNGNRALILMITGQSGLEHKLDAYAGGADDYLVKPFRMEELVAKIRAWLKRNHDFIASDVSSTILAVGDLRLDLLKRRAVRGDQVFPLT